MLLRRSCRVEGVCLTWHGRNYRKRLNKSRRYNDQNIHMKRFTSLLIGCSMALAGVAIAQQPNGEASPGKKKKQGAEQTHAAQPKPNPNVARPHATPVRAHGAANEPVT